MAGGAAAGERLVAGRDMPIVNMLTLGILLFCQISLIGALWARRDKEGSQALSGCVQAGCVGNLVFADSAGDEVGDMQNHTSIRWRRCRHCKQAALQVDAVLCPCTCIRAWLLAPTRAFSVPSFPLGSCDIRWLSISCLARLRRPDPHLCVDRQCPPAQPASQPLCHD